MSRALLWGNIAVIALGILACEIAVGGWANYPATWAGFAQMVQQ